MANKRKHTTKRTPRRATPAPSRKPAPSGPLAGFTPSERRGLEGIFEMALERVQFVLTDTIEPMDVQAWASYVCGIWYGKHLIGQDTDNVFAGGLVDYVTRKRGPAAVRVLRALASVLSDPYAERAREAADRLVAAGHADPPWAEAIAAPTTPTHAVLHRDPVDDDGVTVMVEFTGPVGTHTIGVYIDRNIGGITKDLFLNPTPLDEVADKLRTAMAANKQVETVLEDIGLEDASTLIHEGMRWLDRTLDPPINADVPKARALVLTRLNDMPAPGEPADPEPLSDAQRDALRAEFVASPFAQALGHIDPDLVHDLVFNIVWYSSDYASGTPLRFSPVMVEVFCCSWAPRKIVGDASSFDALPDVLRAWIRFAGDRRGIPENRIEEAVAAVAKHEDELREQASDADAWGPAKQLGQAMQAYGIDVEDPSAIRAFIEKVNAGEVDIRV